MLENRKEELYEWYVDQNLSSIDIAEKIGVSKQTVLRALRRFGISKSAAMSKKSFSKKMRTLPRRSSTYKINESYFDKIDTQEKAYFLGLLFADGSLSKHHLSGKKIKLTLTSLDKHIVLALRDAIFQNEKPDLYRIPAAEYFNKKTGKVQHHKEQFSLTICSKRIHEALTNLGCGNRKTYTISFPELPKEMRRHFIRGYFDGDGTIYFTQRVITERLMCHVGMVSNHAFCDQTASVISDALAMKVCVNKRNKNPGISDVRMGGNRKTQKFLDWIYKDATCFLYRKRDMYEKLLLLNKGVSV